jgi:hypothetical protein
MKSRHAAVLALVGWYLMIPAPLTAPPSASKVEAPLSSWHKMRTSPTEADCQNYLSGLRAKVRDPEFQAKSTIENGWTWPAFIDFWDAAKCISDDDPRLKSN